MRQHTQTEVDSTGLQQAQITIAVLTIAWFFILLRTWTRTWVISNFGWDDATMILAGMIFTVFSASQLHISANGGGTHITSVQHQQELAMWVLMSEASYVVSMMTIKISVGIFFTRIIVKRAHFILAYVCVGANIASSLSALFYCIFRCGPDLSQYIIKHITKQCTPLSGDMFMAYQQGVFSTLTDIVFIILPVLILWNALMDLRTKLSVGFVLSLAALGCICSIIRFRYINGLVRTEDYFWNVVNVAIWSTIESGACITAGCIATLRPLFKCILDRARASSELSRTNTTPLSRSARSTQVSYLPKSAHSSSTPHYDIALAEIDRACCSSEDKRPELQYSCEPLSSVSLAPTGDEVVTLSSDIGFRRTSMEPILDSPELAIAEFGRHYDTKEWPGEETEKTQDQSARESWSFRKDTVVVIASARHRPNPSPVSSECYGKV